MWKKTLLGFSIVEPVLLGVTWLGIVSPGLAISVPNAPSLSQFSHLAQQDLLQQGKALYDIGQFAEAINVLQTALQSYRLQRNELRQAAALSNLALAYQHLGQWSQANQAVADSLNLLRGRRSEATQNSKQMLAQTLKVQGSLQLNQGQVEQALATWQQAEIIYVQLSDRSGILHSRINQARALQVLGFYRRALITLSDLKQTLQSHPNSLTKVIELRSLGDALQLAGDLDQSRQLLQQSLDIAQSLRSTPEMSMTLLSLGNTARAQQQMSAALNFYQQAASLAPDPLTKVQALTNALSVFTETEPSAASAALQSQIQLIFDRLPPSRDAIYARINFAHILMKSGQQGKIQTPQAVARLLAIAAQQARSLADQRSEAYALGTLGQLYEQNQQWQEAQTLTQQALTLTQVINAPDIAYRWHWQLGRLLKHQGDVQGAITAYDAAVNELQSIRSDLVAVNRTVQFSFRESVEPVYRESVALLLQFQKTSPSEQTLDKARQRIESLQLAELDDFFREACLNAKTVLLDKVVDRDNPTTAIIYPIILPNQLEVIVKIPNRPLQLYTVRRTQREVETLLQDLRFNLTEPDAADEVQALSQQVYHWLIQPVASELEKSSVNTLVFVLDGALRSVPMAALYDGKQYLIEKYAVSLSLGLQLLEPKSLDADRLKILAGGLIQPPPDFQKFPPLPEIKSEFNLITQSGIDTQQILDQAFTSKNLEKQVNTIPFNVVHLATHGQFSSQAKDTFILAADGPINVTQLDALLRNRDRTGRSAIELLVLSACQTAAGDNRATLGLAGVAIRAGARSTLASLWHINDRSTAIFIGEFYRELASAQVTKAEALRRAQIALLKQYPNYSRPGYWAPYVLVGNWL